MNKIQNILKKRLIKAGTDYVNSVSSAEPIMKDEISEAIVSGFDIESLDVESLLAELADSSAKSVIDNIALPVPDDLNGDLFGDDDVWRNHGMKINGGIIKHKDALPDHFLKRLENINDNLAKQQKSALKQAEITNKILYEFNTDIAIKNGGDALASIRRKEFKQKAV